MNGSAVDVHQLALNGRMNNSRSSSGGTMIRFESLDLDHFDVLSKLHHLDFFLLREFAGSIGDLPK